MTHHSLLYLSIVLSAHGASLTPQPTITVQGLAALKMAETGSRSWIVNFGGGSPGGGLYCFCDYGGSHYNLPKVATLNGQTITQTYIWGTCNVTFKVLSDKTLDISGSVTNSSSAALTNLQLILGKIAFPGNAQLGNYPLLRVVNTTLNPGFTAINGSGGGITCDFVFTDQLGWPGAIHLGALNWGNNALYADSVTLPPAHTLSFDFHANFFSTSAEVDNVVRTVSARFGQLYPQTTYSHDIRPIGQIFFVTGPGSGWAANNALWATNPRGWLGDPTINVFTAAGAAAFKQRMVTLCTGILHNVASLPLRGFIIWDVEGEQYPNGPATYIGHPSWLPQVAPEMDAIINDLVKIFTNAGYQVGFTLRQQMLVANPGNPQLSFYNINWPQGEDSAQAEADLDAQVRYCQSRFGSQARLFYVDSNPGQEINTFHTLSAAHPDCLFAPECNGIVIRMYAYCQPYQTGRPVTYVRQGLATQPQFVLTYPRAQSLINLADVADTPANETAIEAGMLRGDIPLIRVWWATSPEIALLQKINPVVRSQGWTGTR